MGGMAWVGMNSRSFAYMAMSDRSPFERLMSDTCAHRGEMAYRTQGLQSSGTYESASRQGAHRYIVPYCQPSQGIVSGDLCEQQTLQEEICK